MRVETKKGIIIMIQATRGYGFIREEEGEK